MAETIALIGFGEAGQSIARGLGGSSDVHLKTFDITFNTPGDVLRPRANALGVTPCDDSQSLIDGSTIIFSFVVGSQAVAAAAAAAPYLRPEHIYIDCNSVSPASKRAVAAAVAGSGCRFFESAVMAPVPPYLHKVPMLLAGAGAADLVRRLAALDMSCEVAGEEIGQASLNKMVRSIMIKGIEALLFESLAVAQKYGIEERIFDSVSETLPGLDWRQLATYNLGRISVHGVRRASEMKEAAATVAECGIEPIMAAAIADRIATAHGLIGGVAWPDGAPEHYKEIFAVLAERLEGGPRAADYKVK